MAIAAATAVISAAAMAEQHRWPQLQQWWVQLQRLQQPPQRGPDGPGQYTHRYVGAATSFEPCVSSLAFVIGLGATSPTARLSFTLDSGASSCFFRDCTDLTPLHTTVTVSLADPSVGSVVAESTTTLPCAGIGGASSAGAGGEGAGARGASSEGVGAEGTDTGGASSWGARAKGTGTRGATFGGARVGGADTGGASFGGACFGGVGVGEVGIGEAKAGATAPVAGAPAAAATAATVKLFLPVSGFWTLGLPSSSPHHSPPPSARSSSSGLVPHCLLSSSVTVIFSYSPHY
ncbi:unnamed protein product [Closterium sp. NIES-54]